MNVDKGNSWENAVRKPAEGKITQASLAAAPDPRPQRRHCLQSSNSCPAAPGPPQPQAPRSPSAQAPRSPPSSFLHSASPSPSSGLRGESPLFAGPELQFCYSQINFFFEGKMTGLFYFFKGQHTISSIPEVFISTNEDEKT